MPFPVNPVHRLLLEDGTSYLLLEDGSSKFVLDEVVALDDPLDATTVSSTTPSLTFIANRPLANAVVPAVVQTINQQAASSAVVTFTLANTPAPGNILVAFTDYSQFANIRTVGSAAGTWNKVFDVTEATNNDSSALWWHVVQPGDGKTWTFPVNGTTADKTAGQLYEISGADTDNPIPVANYATANIAAATVNVVTTPSVTPTAYNTMALGHWTFDTNTLTYSSITVGWTLDGQNDATNHGNYTGHRNSLTTDLTTAMNVTFTATGSTSANSGVSATVLINPPLQEHYEVQVDTVNTFGSQNAGGSGSVDQSQTTTSTNFQPNVSGSGQTDVQLGQSFTSSVTGTMPSVTFQLMKSGSPTDNLFVEVRSGSTTGTVLATSANVSAAGLTTSWVDTSFTFSSPASLTAGTKYYLVISRSGAGDGTNFVNVNDNNDTGANYTGGDEWNNLSGTWTQFTGSRDLYFKTFMVPNTPLIDALSDTNLGFTDDTTSNADDFLLLEDGVSKLLLEDNSSRLVINYSYPVNDYVTYRVQTALTSGNTYYWRVRQKVSGGSYGAWSSTQSFTVTLGGGPTNMGQFFLFF